MTGVDPDQVKRVGVVGAGVIGGGWALHYLRMGLDVDVYDPAPSARPDLLTTLEEKWPLLERMGLARGASPDRLSFTADLAAAVAGADVVQENSPEDLSVKREVIAAIDRVAPPDTVIASSTSGFTMTTLQAGCAIPQRCVVGHPFNPPYLIPLVEVVGGELTDPAAVDWLAGFYAAAGKRPLRLSRELPGFVGNRLQEALWREALHMVAEGEATVEEIDEAIAFGPGLRWAQMGPCMTLHLAGGSAGMAHTLDHFGAALLEPWTRLEAPPLTGQLRERMVDGCNRMAHGRSVAELERQRDDFLAELLGLVQRYSAEPPGQPEAATRPGTPGQPEAPLHHAAARGRAEADRAGRRELMGRFTTPLEGRRPGPWPPGPQIPAPLRLHETAVAAEWTDYNGHLSEWAYLLVFGDSADAFFRFFGVDEAYRAAGRSLFTAETHLRHLREARAGDRLRLTLQVLGVDAKRLHIAHEMLGDTGQLLATAEQMLLHVDTRAGKVTAFPGEIGGRLRQIRDAHAALRVPSYIGHVMAIPGG